MNMETMTSKERVELDAKIVKDYFEMKKRNSRPLRASDNEDTKYTIEVNKEELKALFWSLLEVRHRNIFDNELYFSIDGKVVGKLIDGLEKVAYRSMGLSL